MLLGWRGVTFIKSCIMFRKSYKVKLTPPKILMFIKKCPYHVLQRISVNSYPDFYRCFVLIIMKPKRVITCWLPELKLVLVGTLSISWCTLLHCFWTCSVNTYTFYHHCSTSFFLIAAFTRYNVCSDSLSRRQADIIASDLFTYLKLLLH